MRLIFASQRLSGPPRTSHAMGWITRRIAGFITFAIVSSVLTGIAVTRGWLSGEPNLTTTTGVAILGVAFLASLLVTSQMKSNDKARKAWDEYNRAWQDYYARMGYYQYYQNPPQR
jgi:hypothetical protein